MIAELMMIANVSADHREPRGGRKRPSRAVWMSSYPSICISVSKSAVCVAWPRGGLYVCTYVARRRRSDDIQQFSDPTNVYGYGYGSALVRSLQSTSRVASARWASRVDTHHAPAPPCLSAVPLAVASAL